MSLVPIVGQSQPLSAAVPMASAGMRAPAGNVMGPYVAPSPVDKTDAAILSALQQDPHLAQNMMREAGRYEEEAMALRQDAKSLAREMEQDIRMLTWNFELLHQDFFKSYHALGDENQDFYMENQYTNRDRAGMIQRNRKPYEFNIITPFVDNLRGEQLGQRTMWEAYGANPFSDQYAEGATHFLNWVRQSYDNDYASTESDVFTDGLVRGIGVTGIRPDWTNPFGSVRIERYKPREFMWDIHTAQNRFLDGAKYLWRGFYMDRVQLASMFPEWAKEILELSGLIPSRQGFESDYVLNRPKVRPLTGDMAGYVQQFDPQIRTVYGGLIFCREFYHRRFVPKWKVMDGHTGEAFFFDSERDALDAARMYWQWFMQSGMAQIMGVDRPLVSAPMPCTMPVIDQYIFAGDQLLRCTTQKIERFPFEFFIPDFYDNTIVSFLERGKHRQRFINRLISYMEEIAGSTKPQIGINKGYLAGQGNDSALFDKMVQQGIWLYDTRDPNFDIKRHMSSFNPQQNGQMVASLLATVKDTMVQLYGSSVTMGAPDYSGQSAQSQMALKSYASTTTLSVFGTLQDMSKRVAQQALSYGQFIDPTVSMAVRQDSGEMVYRSLQSFGIQRLGDLKFQVEVSEVLATPTEIERRQQIVLSVISQLGPERGAAFENLILKYSKLPYSDKKQISDKLAQIDQMEAEAQERELSMKESTVRAANAARITQAINKSRELDLAEKNPAKINVQYKMPAGPLTTQAILEHAGIDDAHPAMLESDYAHQAEIDQIIADVQQQHYYRNVPTWARQQAQSGLKAGAAPGKPTTPKDARARKNKGPERT